MARARPSRAALPILPLSELAPLAGLDGDVEGAVPVAVGEVGEADDARPSVATTGEVLLVAVGEMVARRKPVSGTAPLLAVLRRPVRFADASMRSVELKY